MGEPDDRDVADQVAAAEKLIAAFDRADEDERRCRAELAPLIEEAERLAKAGEYEPASRLFDRIAAGFLLAGIGGYKRVYWIQRAADCRAAMALGERRKRKTRGGAK